MWKDQKPRNGRCLNPRRDRGNELYHISEVITRVQKVKPKMAEIEEL